MDAATTKTTKAKGASSSTAGKKSKSVRITKPVKEAKPKKEKAPKEPMVVFAFRLTKAQRDLIHKAAGPGKASQFVRTLTVAASKKDETAVGEIVQHIK